MKKQKSMRKQQMVMAFALVVFLLILIGISISNKLLAGKGNGIGKEKNTGTVAVNAGVAEKNETEAIAILENETYIMKRAGLMEQAEKQAAGYDYDGAITLLKTLQDYGSDAEIMERISAYEETKNSCEPVNIDEVTHIFYHSLVVDPARAFANQETNPAARGNNQWMTTVSEFEKITQEMYERGYVLVSIHDLLEEAADENGNVVYEPGTIMLPPGKKAFVMSLDDLSYYHSYDNYGYASKLILDENGEVTCEYIREDGTVEVGAYDVVPLMDKFIEEHPDAAYRGAKGTIALTGYNGILGYRTDITYETLPDDVSAEKRAWVESHPDFSLKAEREEAKKVADAMKENGWEFASHTWGHLRVGTISMERLQADTERFKENVEPLVGSIDTIIFAHGEDLGSWGDYDPGNLRFQYLKEQGYRIFCNVDSAQYGTWFGKDYMRQSRRNLDGYRIYFNATGVMDSVSDLFDAKEIIDPLRPPVMPLK